MITRHAPSTPAVPAAAAAHDKEQDFAHRIVEFADFDVCCKFFREKAVAFDVPNEAGWSLLMRICACVPNRTNVLHLAAMSSNSQVMQELVATAERRAKLQAVVDLPNINGDTPLMMASVAKNADAARLLLSELSANASFGNANGMTALMCAARLGDPSAPNSEHHVAASDEIVRLLLASGVHANATELAAGNSALHFAVLSHNTLGVQALTERSVDADVLLRNKAGLTAIDLAKRVGASAEIVACLKRKLAELESAAAEKQRALENDLLQEDETTAAAPKRTTSSKSRRSKSKAKKALAKDRSVEKMAADSEAVAADVAAKKNRELEQAEAAGTSLSPSHGSVSYHALNAVFHRTFPLAEELDIPVEAFVIASSSTDIELQPSDGGLSISQLEALQEAHLRAYHYLNEKKMELARVLEAQRLEAHFALQSEILSLDK
ncbi:hypothetical protein PybrP1_007796 [[Pythium] brassicae (nom. inval.)]|nr:hypothetical protein PybrP1_007796 [[Pythium] brassicae (nom. inval.)]